MKINYNYILFFSFVSLFNSELKSAQAGLPASQPTQSNKEEIRRWFAAAESGNLEEMQKLIGTVDLNVQKRNGDTALIIAISKHHKHIIKWLLQASEININFSNCAALLEAVTTHQEDVVKLLLSMPGIDINGKSTKTYMEGSTALIFAARSGISVPAELSGKDTDELSQYLPENCLPMRNIFKLLVNAPGIDVNIPSNAGETALSIAASQGFEYYVRLLLEVPEINVNMKYSTGHNIALEATKKQPHGYNNPAIAKLIQNKINEPIFNAIKQKNVAGFITAITEAGLANIIIEPRTKLLSMAFAANCSEIVLYILQNIAQDPQELLTETNAQGLYPFEGINPTSDLFKLCIDLAYGSSGEKVSRKRKVDAAEDSGQIGRPSVAHVFNSSSDGSEPKNCANCLRNNCVQKCSKCQQVYYCSTECQKADWKIHKTQCYSPKKHQ